MLCALKRFFDAQRIDKAGRHAVRLQKCLIIIYTLAMLKFGLTVLLDPVTATLWLCATLTLLYIGWYGSTRRHRGFLMVYQLLASFVFALIVTLTVLGITFVVLGAGVSISTSPMDDVEPSSSAMMTLHQHVTPLRAYVPETIAVGARAVLPASLTTVSKAETPDTPDTPDTPSPPPPEGLPGTDEIVGGVTEDRLAPIPIGAILGFMVAVCLGIVAFVVLAVILVGLFGLLTVVPLGALLFSIFFAAATRRSLSKKACAVEASEVAEAGRVEIPMVPVTPAAGAAPVPGNVVYVPHTSMFPMSPAGQVSNPYSGVIYVSSPDEPTK